MSGGLGGKGITSLLAETTRTPAHHQPMSKSSFWHNRDFVRMGMKKEIRIDSKQKILGRIEIGHGSSVPAVARGIDSVLVFGPRWLNSAGGFAFSA